MKLNLKSLLSDKNVLRIVAIISVMNLMGYVMLRNLDAVAFFVIVGFLTTYFSKNMIVVLLVAMVSTNFLVASRMVPSGFKESMKGGRKSTSDAAKKDKDTVEDDSVATGELEATGRPGKLDDAATFEAAHENLQNLLGPDAISKMSADTQALMAKQQGLQESLESLMPAVNQSMKTLEKLGGMDKLESMIGKVSKVMDTFGGIGKR
jgi:hypothetical protein